MSKKHVGVIGLGAMGRGIAQTLRTAGYPVHVCDVRAQAVQDFVADGGVACACARSKCTAPGCSTR